jgi:high affinity Mn2+ porin
LGQRRNRRTFRSLRNNPSRSNRKTGPFTAREQLPDCCNPPSGVPYQGPQSLSPATNGRETVDITLYAGIRNWPSAEIWINPEVDQGFGLSNTFGVAGYPSGEAYKVGKAEPYFLVQRGFLRQTINLGGETEELEPGLSQLGGTQTANRLVFTLGKYSIVDIFDTNKYAHDPRHDFLNWSIIDMGAFDYAANSWSILM